MIKKRHFVIGIAMVTTQIIGGCYESSTPRRDTSDRDTTPDTEIDFRRDPDISIDPLPDHSIDPPPDQSICYSNANCPRNYFCYLPPGQCTGSGVCYFSGDEPCPPTYDPECGCDGVTYSNYCVRIAAGVSLAHEGECSSVECGVNSPPCPEGSFCEYPEGTCGLLSFDGVCIDFPNMCPEYYSPICGCDSQTYTNDCYRQSAGVSACHRGECPEQGCGIL